MPPVMEGYIHADTPHPATVAPAGRLEGCNSQITGDTRPRGRPTTSLMQNGWTKDGRRIMKPIVTGWLPRYCMFLERYADPACTGCANRRENPSDPPGTSALS